MNRSKTAPRILMALLLCALAGAALANPFRIRDKEQGYERAGYERPRERHRAQKMRRDEVSQVQRQRFQQGRGSAGKANQPPQANEASYRNGGRMSPEERRTLRRQINEANQAIPYRGKP